MIQTKIELLHKLIETKDLLKRYGRGELPQKDLALLCLEDEDRQRIASALVQRALHPTPLLRDYRTDDHLDIGYGISVFWQTLFTPGTDVLEATMELEQTLLHVEAGKDTDLHPDTRRWFLGRAGLSKEEQAVYVPLKAYYEYDQKRYEKQKAEAVDALGFSEPLDLSQQVQVDAAVMQENLSMQGPVSLREAKESTYEDLYGMSAQTIYDLFTPKEEREAVDLTESSPAQYSMKGDVMAAPMEELFALYDATIEENEIMLMEAELEASLGLSEEDLQFGDLAVER